MNDVLEAALGIELIVALGVSIVQLRKEHTQPFAGEQTTCLVVGGGNLLAVGHAVS